MHRILQGRGSITIQWIIGDGALTIQWSDNDSVAYGRDTDNYSLGYTIQWIMGDNNSGYCERVDTMYRFSALSESDDSDRSVFRKCLLGP